MPNIPLSELIDNFIYVDGILYNKYDRGPNSRAGACAAAMHSTGYFKLNFQHRTMFAHRAIFLMHYKWLPRYLDHIDMDKLNNHIENLRPCTASENCRNHRGHKDRASRFKGVSWHKTNKKWVAQITINGRVKNLGYFKEEVAASDAYDAAAAANYGKYAFLNNGVK